MTFGPLRTSAAPAPDAGAQAASAEVGPAVVLLEPAVREVLSGADLGPRGRLAVVSASEGFDPTLVTALTASHDVITSAPVRSAVVGLFGSVDAEGRAHDVVADGFRIPVTVMALEPATYLDALATVPPEDAEQLLRLASGEVLLSTSSAALRGLGPGARVAVGEADGLRVVGVVGDRTARGSEFLVHLDDADVVGLGDREALLMRYSTWSADAFDDHVGAIDSDLRVWHDRGDERLVLSQVELKQRFGEFAFRLILNQREVEMDRAFVAEHITIERMPVLGNVRCHRLIMDDLRAALEEVVAAGLEDWLAPRRYGGCYHPRRIAFGRENLSRHSWGIAIDLNVDFTLPGAGPVPPDEFIAIMGRHGFRWGGDFAAPDNHHFEWVGESARVRPQRD